MGSPSDKAVEAAARLARAPRCSDWGERLTDARVRALLEVAYPIIRADVLAECCEALSEGCAEQLRYSLTTPSSTKDPS